MFFLKKKKTSAYIPTTSKNHSADKHKEKHTQPPQCQIDKTQR